MKRTLLTAFVTFAAYAVLAQSDGLSYQAIIIDNRAQEIPGLNVSGNYLSEGEVALRFTIYDQFGQMLYQESHETVTDKFGMVQLTIGRGEVSSPSPGHFDQIDWDGTPKELLVELGIAGSPLEAFSRQELLFVPYAYHRNVYAAGTLTVEGQTVLNNSFTVANQSLSTLSGDLVVQGTSTFDGDAFFQNISVANWTELYGTLRVGDSATFQSALSVLNESPTLLSGELQVSGNAHLGQDVHAAGNAVLEGMFTANSTAALNGQVTINAQVSGGESSYNAYPLRVQGSSQGVAIKVSSNTPNGTNNFITFFDGQNQAVGRIEGQTSAEVASSPAYIYETAMLAANVAIATSNVLGATTSSTVCAGLGACVTAPIPSLTATSAANLVLAIANLTAYQIFAYENLGVTYESGSADYAEWLQRANPAEQMSFGDIVSVHGGKISKNTDFGSQMMVVSFKPAVLGNMPPDGEKHLYEKVAFLGQVPVKVKGRVNVGDYILPGGASDGFGVAVHPAEMKTDDFSKIVGTAWSASDDPRSSYVNVAIGMNRNDLVHLLSRQQDQLQALRSEMDEMHALLAELLPGYADRRQMFLASPRNRAETPSPKAPEAPTAEEMHFPMERSAFVAGLELVKAQLRGQGIQPENHPVYKAIFNDEAAVNKIIDQAMHLAAEHRARAISIDKEHGYK